MNLRIAALAAKEWRILLRDRQGMAVLFLMPAAFILIMSLALRDALSPTRTGALTVLWLDQDRSYFALALSDALQGHAQLQAVKDDAALQSGLAAGAAPFAVRIAPQFAARIAEGQGAAPLVQALLSPSAPPQARLLFLAQLRAALAQVQAEWLMEDEMGVPHADAEKMRARLDPSALKIEETYPGAVGPPNAVQQAVPAWLVFAMFFVVLPIGVSVLAEREQGNLRRLSLLNLPPALLLAGKFPAYYVVNLAQFALMLAVGVWAVPALGGDRLALGHSLPALWLVASALSIAAIGFALAIAVIARSSVQATTLGGVANLLLGAVGGVMVPKLVMPPAMQAASVISPMSWALEACWDILLRGGGVTDVLPECAALVLFGAAGFTVATLLFPTSE
ncbi:MAG TPA: ABC transporter permease [Candidatus Binatia bacterium]|nr:ABC transporter permease [Candidatus Binatia bacterium]